MLKETNAGSGIAAVVQDALTGEVLWVGHLEAGAPKRIAETGIVRMLGLYDGEPIAVRHLSSSGEGMVIHVEGPSTRHQMDSMIPEPVHPFSQNELAEFSQAIATRRDSGKWEKVHSPETIATTASSTARLVASVEAFELIKSSGPPPVIAERAAAVLWSLLEELRDAEVPVPMTVEAFNQYRQD